MNFKIAVLISLNLLLISSSFGQTTYVNSGASGNNDGSTWEHAYSSLTNALANTSNGELWIASGTYNHDAAIADTFNTFFIKGPIKLYGGFAATENSKEERVIGENETILSGDFNGDDMVGVFGSNKTDNAFHVITVDSLIVEPVVFDGLTITGGHTGVDADAIEYLRRGGGIYSYATLAINNCKFSGNFANAGAGIFLTPETGGGDGSQISNCSFTDNRSKERGAGAYFYDLSDVIIEGNTFSENQVGRGCIYPFDCDNTIIRNNTFTNNVGSSETIYTTGIFLILGSNNLIENCTFSNSVASNGTGIYFEGDGFPSENVLSIKQCTFSGNLATDFGGADLFFWQATGVLIENCTFSNASGPNGGVLYHDGRDTPLDPSNLIFRDCTFTDNEATGFGGGALYSWQGGMTIENCIFTGHSAPNAGCFYIDNREKEGLGLIVNNSIFSNNSGSDFGGGAIRANQTSVQIESSEFTNNSCANGGSIFMYSDGRDMDIRDCLFSGGSGTFGGAMTCYGLESDFNLENLTFAENQATSSGGAIITGFGANARISGCEFQSGFASSGGALRVQNDQTLVEVVDCLFNMNEAEGSGGAIYMSGGVNVEIEDCDFTNNTAERGGAVSTFETMDDSIASKLEVLNSMFAFNAASQQGGALNIIDTDAKIVNSLINNNFNLNGFSGGGISGNASDSSGLVTIEIVNSTIAGNEGAMGHGIGLFTSENESSLTMTIRNTILANEGTNYEIEAGNPVVISEGGNVISDGSLDDILTGPQDKSNAQSQIFAAYDDFDYHLAFASLAINIGQGMVTDFDIEGMPRVNAPDAGAYEFQLDVSIEEVIASASHDLDILPNPVADRLNIQIENEWSGLLKIQLYDMTGKLMETWQASKSSRKSNHSFYLTDMVSGVYNVIVGNGEKAISAKVVKVD